jgi:site-specific recombinase XerD
MNEYLIEQWAAWMREGNLAPKTIRLRTCLLWTFARHHDLRTAQPSDIHAHLASRPGGAWSKASHLASLRGFYRFALRSGLVDHDPTLLAHPIRVPAKVQEPIPRPVLAAALAKADERACFMMLLAARAGLRRAEIAELNSDEIAATHLTITGKGQRVRVIPVHRDLRALLATVHGWAFPSRKRPGEHLTPDHVGSIVKAATGGWTAHSLRRRFATDAYEGTSDLRSVQDLLGHASPTTTAKYVRSNEAALRRAVDAVA